MSSTARPISAEAFELAIKDLLLANLYGKAAELQNSIAHLRYSNEQLESFAEDPDCAEAIRENREVIENMEWRVASLRREVESRGARWMDAEVEENESRTAEEVTLNGTTLGEPEAEEQATFNGASGGSTNAPSFVAAQSPSQDEPQRGGRLTDEELRTRLRDMVESEDNDDDGLHL
ncbi:MAG: hypothetical protein M4579_002639 [Chaenotheca gracillima]|nr:MAG: hypothetical protein M4579_002639 [Chaenotheca gracillima]